MVPSVALRSLCTGLLGLACLAFAACRASDPDNRLDTIHERILSVERNDKGGAVVQFELSQRLITIDPVQSPSAGAMIEFAEAARLRRDPVFATIDRGPRERTKFDDLGSFVLVRLAATPDPATKRLLQ